MFSNIKIILIFFICIISIFNNSNSKEIRIILKINNDIVTNHDIQNEIKYLLALNENLNNLDSDQLFLVGKDSLLREIIKKNEIIKLTNLGERKKIYDDSIIQLISKINLSSIDSFKSYLKEKGLDYDTFYKKIEIENLWNQLVYNTYKDKVIINEDELKKKILSSKEKKNQLKISEIVYETSDQKNIQSKYDTILNIINKNGFNEAVALFSIADSKKNSGNLGWVDENSLSNQILNEISNLNPGDISKPIIIPSGVLIIKVDNKRTVERELNMESELDKMISFEINSQLNIFSQILFNKVKDQNIINEL